MVCKICGVDPVVQNHHIIPKSRGGSDITVECCSDCGNQIHMLFTNKKLAELGFEGLMKSDVMRKYIQWKRKHPGDHTYRASRKVKEWNRYHR
jgi:hypothetical protein